MEQKKDNQNKEKNSKQNLKKQSVLIRLLSYVKPHWYLILISTIGGVIKLTLPLVLPQVLKYFTDEVLVSEIMSSAEKINEIIKWLFILLFLYICVYIPVAFLRQAGSTEVSNRIMHKMRCEVYEYLQRMSAAFHHENKSGNLVTRINNDVELVHGFIWNVATNIWIDGIVLIVYLVLMGMINLPLTILAGIALPISVMITKRIRMHIKHGSRNVQKNIAEISGYMQERMAGFATVKLFNMEKEEQKKFDGYSKLIYKYTQKRNNYASLGEAVTGAMSEIICAVIVCLSAIYIVNGKMTVGELIVFYSYLGYFITPLRRFSELNVTYAKSIAGIERVFDILDTPLDIQEREDALPIAKEAPMDVKFRHVWFRYEKEKEENTLADIHFNIAEGENVALVGSSGCGKTTLVNLLTRFYDTDEGEIFLAGKNIRDYKLESLYQNMGMVFQDTVLFSGTIEENIRYGKIDATEEEVIEAVKAANAYDFIMNTPQGFDTILGERGIGLSGGQKQRLAIARVFLKNPRLLILDEATSALDSESEELVQEALEHLMKGRTSIVIAHRLSTIVKADKIIVMDRGKVVEVGNHAELLEKNGRYAELYHMQFKDILGEQES